jgi:mevalonate kinase
MGFFASAPCKGILFGEHYVVYGAPALAVAIEPRNTVKFEERLGASGSDARALLVSGVYGNGAIDANGNYSGAPELAIYAEVARKVFGASSIPAFSAEFFPSWKIKGAGASASLCAAFAAGCFKLAGKVPSNEEIFAAAQAGDLLAHGGKASGIDAKTVSFGKPLVFQRSFEPPAFNSSPAGFVLPPGVSLLLVDTNVGIKDTTSKLIGIFAESLGITSPPQDLPAHKRAEVLSEYEPVWEKVQQAMMGATGKGLGALMNENHDLLKARGVSSAGIEKAIATALAAGAYGAKMTGAGGEGGAVLVLCEEASKAKVSAALKDACGFVSYPVSLAKKGAGID